MSSVPGEGAPREASLARGGSPRSRALALSQDTPHSGLRRFGLARVRLATCLVTAPNGGINVLTGDEPALVLGLRWALEVVARGWRALT